MQHVHCLTPLLTIFAIALQTQTTAAKGQLLFDSWASDICCFAELPERRRLQGRPPTRGHDCSPLSVRGNPADEDTEVDGKSSLTRRPSPPTLRARTPAQKGHACTGRLLWRREAAASKEFRRFRRTSPKRRTSRDQSRQSCNYSDIHFTHTLMYVCMCVYTHNNCTHTTSTAGAAPNSGTVCNARVGQRASLSWASEELPNPPLTRLCRGRGHGETPE